MEKERRKHPIGAEHYTLYEEVGAGVSASVYRAMCIPLNEIVAIKILDFERSNTDMNNISREAHTMILVDHPNVLKSHCSFVSDHNLWVVMPYMAGGSCLHILKAAYPDGFEEVVIATILREVLKGLDYLHERGLIHRDVKAGNILINSCGGIKLGDFGVSAYLFDCGDRQRMRNTFVGTPCWMAPEVVEQSHGYDFKVDIWSFGITGLELAHGHAPFSKYPPLKVLLMTLQNAPPGFDYERDKKFSKSFKQMIASCLVKDPSKRPPAKKLLKHSFFKQARSNDYIVRHLLEGLPALGDSVKAFKKKEEDMLAEKKMPDGEEEKSQNEYERGISDWDFNLDDMKAQASMFQIPDDDPAIEKDEDTPTKQHQQYNSFARQYSDASDDTAPISVSSGDSATNNAKFEKSDGDAGAPDLTNEHPTTTLFLGNENQAEYNSVENPALVSRKPSGAATSSITSEKIQNQSQNLSHDGPINLQTSDSAPPEIINKGSKTSVNGDDDEKAKNHVVQRKGRFKVTSENIDREKVVPSPIIPKSHSVQVIASVPSSPRLPFDVTLPNPCSPTLFPTLQTTMDANILEGDGLVKAMKQASNGDASGLMSLSPTTDKTPFEVAHEKEKELVREMTDLMCRLLSTKEELQKCRKERAHAR